MILLFFLLAFGPGAELAPGAPELIEAQSELGIRLRAARSVGQAVLRLQGAWTQVPVDANTKKTCAQADRIELGWRIERFGAAWREAVQAARAQSALLAELSKEPTLLPLLNASRSQEITELIADVERESVIFLEASAWEAQYIRPLIAQCPYQEARLMPGMDSEQLLAADEDSLPVAILALGSGYICPGGQRADGAVVLARSGRACWSVTPDCSCEIRPVLPGAVLGP
jgi:hypothetical protein